MNDLKWLKNEIKELKNFNFKDTKTNANDRLNRLFALDQVIHLIDEKILPEEE